MEHIALINVEGILSDEGAKSVCSYLASNAQGVGERFLKLGQLAFAKPLLSLAGYEDPLTTTRFNYFSLRHLTQDRIEIILQEYWTEFYRQGIKQSGIAFLREQRAKSRKVILISENLDLLIEPLSRQLGEVSGLICNRLEFEDRVATGKLCEPVISMGGDLPAAIQALKGRISKQSWLYCYGWTGFEKLEQGVRFGSTFDS